MSRDRIRVTVVAPAGRALQLQYVDPLSGKKIRRSAGTMRRRDAERQAARWEDELRAGFQSGSIGWERFRQRFEDEHLPGLKLKSRKAYVLALDRFEQDVGRPKALAAITSSALSQWRSKMVKAQLRPASVATYMRCLRSAMGWARRIGLISVVAGVPMPTVTGRRGRAVSVGEFARFVQELKRGEDDRGLGEQLAQFAVGLWLSGLRLAEAKALHFEEGPVRLDIGAERPLIHFQDQKSGKVESVPVTPDFARFARRRDPHGPVLPVGLAVSTIGKRLSDAGVRAAVQVGDQKHCSAHDLRRTFGHRWALRVHPLVLKALMRHSSIETTLRYYVELDASDLADQVWDVVSPNVTKPRTSARPRARSPSRKSRKKRAPK